MNKTYAVIFSYSFDSETPVYLFSSLSAAKHFLKKSYLEELRIDREENLRYSKGTIAEDGCYAKIETHYTTFIGITEFRIGNVYN